MIGRTISHYKILEKLGEGGMGVVYKAEDLKPRRFVALKFLPHHIDDEKARQRFIHEARAASALEHPNICAIYEIDETPDGRMFIVMPCYEGESLQAKIESGPLTIDEAIEIARQVGSGLARAHEKGITHRDIKPANIFLTQDGVKIVDFGLAKLAKQTKLTRTGTTVGTVMYMSPEQAKGGETDHRSDLWSLGVVFYEMVTGKLPFRGDHEPAVMYSIMHSEPQPVASLRTGVPTEVDRIFEKCLAKDRVKRYQKAADLVADLHRLQRGMSPEAIHTGAVRNRYSAIPIGFETRSGACDEARYDANRGSGGAGIGVPGGRTARSVVRSMRKCPIWNVLLDQTAYDGTCVETARFVRLIRPRWPIGAGHLRKELGCMKFAVVYFF